MAPSPFDTAAAIDHHHRTGIMLNSLISQPRLSVTAEQPTQIYSYALIIALFCTVIPSFMFSSADPTRRSGEKRDHRCFGTGLYRGCRRADTGCTFYPLTLAWHRDGGRADHLYGTGEATVLIHPSGNDVNAAA